MISASGGAGLLGIVTVLVPVVGAEGGLAIGLALDGAGTAEPVAGAVVDSRLAVAVVETGGSLP